MTHRPEDVQAVARHYEEWPFPGENFSGPEGLLLLRHLNECIRGHGDPSTLRVLDAGCGTGHTLLALAQHFPEVSFVGVDIAQESLRIARRCADERGSPNVAFHRADLSMPLRQGRFQIALSLGVLHHLPHPSEGLRHLADALTPGGDLLLWVYGRHGRYAHSLNQHSLRMLTAGLPRRERYEVARAFVSELGDRFMAHGGFYTPQGSGTAGRAYLLAHPQWLADQMIPARERTVDLTEARDMVRGSGLELRRWLGVPEGLSAFTSSPALLGSFQGLSPETRLAVMDCLLKPDHYFLLCHRPA